MKEYLNDDEFMPFAGSLKLGETIKVEHCKSGKAKLYITRKEDNAGIVAYCHHCSKRGFVANPDVSIGESKETMRSTHEGFESEHDQYSLPSDSEGRSVYWPGAARRWAEQYLTEIELDNSPLCYSESKGGLVFPLFSQGDLIGYQVRKFPEDPNGPKYLTFRGDRGQAALDPFVSRHEVSEIPVLAVVEDWVSAYKIALNTTLDAVPLLGVNCSNNQVQAIVSYAEVAIALDNDNTQVRKAQAKLVRHLSCYSAVRSVLLDKDPKEMSIEELRQEFDRYEW